MENKNVFIAIALSMSVLLFWSAFFETPNPIEDKPLSNTSNQKKIETSNSITPNINETIETQKI